MVGVSESGQVYTNEAGIVSRTGDIWHTGEQGCLIKHDACVKTKLVTK